MEKPRWEESEKRNEEERKIREEKESEERRCVKRKEMQVREKVENRRSAEPSCGRRVEQFHAVGVRSRFGSKNAKKNRSYELLLEVEMWKKCTGLWREAHFGIKNTSAPVHFGTVSSRPCGSKSKCTKKPFSKHCWKLRYWKSVRCCGTEHIQFASQKR